MVDEISDQDFSVYPRAKRGENFQYTFSVSRAKRTIFFHYYHQIEGENYESVDEYFEYT